MILWKVFKHPVGTIPQVGLEVGRLGADTEDQATRMAYALCAVDDKSRWKLSVVENSPWPEDLTPVGQKPAYPSAEELPPVTGVKGGPDTPGIDMDFIQEPTTKNRGFVTIEDRLEALENDRLERLDRGDDSLVFRQATGQRIADLEKRTALLSAVLATMESDLKEFNADRLDYGEKMRGRLEAIEKRLEGIEATDPGQWESLIRETLERLKMADRGIGSLETRDEQRERDAKGLAESLMELRGRVIELEGNEKDTIQRIGVLRRELREQPAIISALEKRVDAADREWEERNSNPAPKPGDRVELKMAPVPIDYFPVEFDAARSPKTSFSPEGIKGTRSALKPQIVGGESKRALFVVEPGPPPDDCDAAWIDFGSGFQLAGVDVEEDTEIENKWDEAIRRHVNLGRRPNDSADSPGTEAADLRNRHRVEREQPGGPMTGFDSEGHG